MKFLRFIGQLLRWTIKICLTVILIGLVAYFLASSNLLRADNKLALAANTALIKVETFLNTHGYGLPKIAPTQTVVADKETNEDNQGAKWPKNQASVYIDIKNAKLKRACLVALQAWNDTGAFKFTLTDDKARADIICKVISNSENGAAGETQTDLTLPRRTLTHATVYLNQYYLLSPAYNYSWQRIINTAEHELGHAIGLRHTNMISVMQPTGSRYSIQPTDVTTVRKLYQ